MGSEFGQFIEWDYKKQLDWFLLGYESHRRLRDFVKELNRYYLEHPEMYDLDCSYDGFKWICVDDNTQNIVSFKRVDEKGEYTVAVVNFSPVRRQSYCMGVPEMRKYKVVLDSNDVRFGGDDAEPARNTPPRTERCTAWSSSFAWISPPTACFISNRARR